MSWELENIFHVTCHWLVYFPWKWQGKTTTSHNLYFCILLEFYFSITSRLLENIWFFISLRFMSNHGSNTNRLSLRESLHHWSIRQDVLLPFRISKDSWYVFFYFFIFLFFFIHLLLLYFLYFYLYLVLLFSSFSLTLHGWDGNLKYNIENEPVSRVLREGVCRPWFHLRGLIKA